MPVPTEKLDGQHLMWAWREISQRKPKIALIIDNCPAHPTIGSLSNARLIFLPPNTTSVSQPMDQGVIRCLKAHYCRRLVMLTIFHLDQSWDLPKITIISVLQLLVMAWNDVTESTVVNCFRSKYFGREPEVCCRWYWWPVKSFRWRSYPTETNRSHFITWRYNSCRYRWRILV